MRSFFNFFFLYIIGCATGITAQTTNQELVDSLVTDMLSDDRLYRQLTAGDSVALHVNTGQKDIDGYLRSRISRALAADSLIIFRNYNDASSFHGIVFELTAFQLKIMYSEPFTRKFLGRHFVERTIVSSIYGQLYRTENQQVLYTLDEDRQYRDVIPESGIEEMESSTYIFFRGERAGHSVWDTFIEPAIVITTVVAVFILFFTQRT